MNRDARPIRQSAQLGRIHGLKGPAEALDRVHGADITDIGNFSQPYSVKPFRYRGAMQDRARVNLRQVIRDNCEALWLYHSGAKRMSWSALAQDTGIGNGTAQRINEMSADARISTLEAIASRYQLFAWHLLLPDLDPANPPVFLMTQAERDLYQTLEASARALAESPRAYNIVKATG